MNLPQRLALPDVTLVCVDTRTPELALRAIDACCAQARFGDMVLFTAPGWVADRPLPEGLRLLPLQIDTVADYSQFMLRGLLPHLHTSHLLVVQWDGHLVDASCWTPEFLACDYIGAPWHDQPRGRAVGNGGFSLRSRRLLAALQDPAMVLAHPEDTCICHTNRTRLEQAHGLRFAPLALAQRFAFERCLPAGPCFGFHGLFNMHHVMSPEALHMLVLALPDALARGLDAHDLCTTLIRLGRLDTAAELIAKRRRLGMHDRRTWRLRLRLALARRRLPWPWARP